VASRPEDVPGYENDAGWFVSTKERVVDDMLRKTPPPRSYGVFDQLRADMRSRTSPPVYLLCILLVGHGSVTANWGTLLFGTAVLVLICVGFVGSIRASRHGVLAVVRITEVQHELRGGQGVNEQMTVDGRTMHVGYDLPIVQALLAEAGAAELHVIYDPRSSRPVAHAVAYRKPPTLFG
jgi:hypothetical protein